MQIRSRLKIFQFLAGILFFSAIPVWAQENAEVAAARKKSWEPIDTGAFADGIRHALTHYRNKNAPYERYQENQIVQIAENLLAWQNPDGGWPKNIDWLRVWSPAEIEKEKSGRRTTLDNRNTWSQIDYLAQIYQRTRLERYAEAALRGIDYLLENQNSSGGWRGWDVDAITFNDDVMVGVLHTLHVVATDSSHYFFVDENRRIRARQAYDAGIRCILRCQIKINERQTAWCQQHSHENFAPVWARSFEPPSITAGESVGVVHLLMQIENPSPEMIQAIQSAVAWFDRVKIAGLRNEKTAAAETDFPYHFSDFDRVEVQDPAAPPIWARYYDLQTEQPIFCTRQKKITQNYTDLSRERRTGYGWYGYWPAKLLAEDYPAWLAKWAPGQSVPEK